MTTAERAPAPGADTAPQLRGVYPVFQTPFGPDERLDAGALADEIEWMIDHGIDGLVSGMVSEVLRLSSEERDELGAAVCRAVRGRVGVVLSVGAESSHTARRHAQAAEEAGADAVMAIPPTTVAIDEDEQVRYYSGLLEALTIPVVVQDASGYVGRPLSISVQAKLLRDYGDRVLFKPEAHPIGPRLSELRDATGGTARVFEGTGGIALLDSYRRGIVGTMPGADLCWSIVALWRCLEIGDMARAYRISAALGALIAIQTSLDSFIAVEKHLLLRQGVLSDTRTRGPVGYRLDDETRDEVDRLFDLLVEAVRS